MSLGRTGLLLGCLWCAGGGMAAGACFALPQAAAPAPSGVAGVAGGVPAVSTPSDPPRKEKEPLNVVGVRFLNDLLQDQKAIWTSPASIRAEDAVWLMPLGLAAAGTFSTDTEFSKHLSNSPSRLKHSNDLSNYGLGSMAGASAGVFLLGYMTHDDHKRETGRLAAEAAIDSFAVDYSLQYTLGRERPLTNDYRGNFWQGGTSFPSDHSAVAWSIASVFAHEYPGPLTEIMAYGMASAVSLSRLTAKQHFPSDVLIGSALGWLVGREVYHLHHDPELGGTASGAVSDDGDSEQHRQPRDMGSTYVPLDSWVYPELSRLSALGYLTTAMEGLRPWTRLECAELTEEAAEKLEAGRPMGATAEPLISRLQAEFAHEINLISGGRNFSASLESIYTRVVSISGPPLTDSYHFGQTISYDFGRPYERGTNVQAGGSFHAEAGPLAIYFRAEYQHAPSAPAPSSEVQQVISLADATPLQPGLPVSGINQLQVLDAYLAVNLGNWQISAGRQSLSWGPGPGGSFLLSNNAVPLTMVRLVNPEPFVLPSFLKFLGPVQADQFFGQLEGHSFVPHPYLYGQKINFKPLPCLEFGFGRTVTIGGEGGNPLTPANFFNSFFARTTAFHGSVPGDSHASFDWTFYVPKVHNYIVFYGDLYADDSLIPWLDQPRNPFRPGIYITRIPGISKLDLHIEATSSESPGNSGPPGKLNYFNSIYRDGYTNDGNLLGNTVGRMGEAYQGWLTYWFSARNTMQLIYKNSSVDRRFIPGGGAWQDYSVQNETYLHSGFYFKSDLQFEHIAHFPVLFHGPQNNFTASLEVGFMPGARR
jgi:membrane-associated phospholipid phosphatase